MTFCQNFFLQDWFRNKFGVWLGYRVRVRIKVMVRVGLWSRVSVSKIVPLLSPPHTSALVARACQ
jgi:hypothetical protein